MSEDLETFIFPWLAVLALPPPSPWPLTFMPCSIGFPVRRSQVPRPRGFDQQMLDVPPGEQGAAMTRGSWGGSAVPSPRSSSRYPTELKIKPKNTPATPLSCSKKSKN